jgi:FkbM family methyltransferase
MNIIKRLMRTLFGESGVTAVKRLVYAHKGEPISYGRHNLRYLPGTRPVRLEYINDPNITIRNDARQLHFFIENVREGNTVLDIGGHNGQYAVLFSSLVGPTGKIVTFEPDATAISILRKNLSLNSFCENVVVEDIALSDKSGTHTFFSRGGDSMSSLARSGLGTNSNGSDVMESTVATMRLDDYLSVNDMGYPQWIKLDTEGAEIVILRGARNLLKSGTTVLCELHPYVWNDFGTTFDELLEIVRECGRSIKYLDSELKIADGAVYGAVIIS